MEEIRDVVYLGDLMCKGEEIKYDERGNILYYRGHEVNEYTFPKRWNHDKIYRDGRMDSKVHSNDCASDLAISAERMRHNQTVSPFFRLPPEIRNQIYAMVFDRSVFYIHCHDGRHWDTICQDEPKAFRFKKAGVSLLCNGFLGYPEYAFSTLYKDFLCISKRSQQSGEYPLWPTKTWLVCKQMYHETALMIYSKATFNFDASTYRARHQFIENRTPTQRAAIRKVAVCLSGIDAISILEQDTAIDRYLPSVPRILQIEEKSNIRTLTGLRKLKYHFHWGESFFPKNEEPLIEEMLREEFDKLSEPIGDHLKVEIYRHFVHGCLVFNDSRSTRK